MAFADGRGQLAPPPHLAPPPGRQAQAHLWVADAPPSSRPPRRPPQVTAEVPGRQPWERGNFLPPCLSWAAWEGLPPSVSSSALLPGRPA